MSSRPLDPHTLEVAAKVADGVADHNIKRSHSPMDTRGLIGGAMASVAASIRALITAAPPPVADADALRGCVEAMDLVMAMSKVARTAELARKGIGSATPDGIAVLSAMSALATARGLLDGGGK